MSLSTNGFKDARNPCKYWLQFHNEAWEWYNKDKKENVVLAELPHFMVLDDRLMKITGYIQPMNAGISSNEVRSSDDTLNVILYHKGGRKEDFKKGSYKQLKDQLPQGAKFTISLYVAMIESQVNPESDSNELVICNLRVAGGVLEGWLDSLKKISNKSELAYRWVFISGYEDKKQGKVEYKSPVFRLGEKKDQAAIRGSIHLDEDLQDYLKDYLAGKVKSEDELAQAAAGEESQEVPEDGPAPTENLDENDDSFLDLRMKSGKTLREHTVAELQAIAKQAEDAGVTVDNPQYGGMLKATKAAIRYKQVENAKKANPFGVDNNSDGDGMIDDDDIPF